MHLAQPLSARPTGQLALTLAAAAGTARAAGDGGKQQCTKDGECPSGDDKPDFRGEWYGEVRGRAAAAAAAAAVFY